MAVNELDELILAPNDATDERRRDTVMVVDDDSSVLEALTLLLKPTYEVLAFTSPHEAVASVSDDVSAVVLDVNLSEQDGFWTCDEIRRKNEHIPVIFFSAYQEIKSPFAIMNQHRPFGYITKGEPSKLLLDLIGRAVHYYNVIAESKRLVAELRQLQASMKPIKPRPGD